MVLIGRHCSPMRPKLTLSGPVAWEARSFFYPARSAGRGHGIVKLIGAEQVDSIPQITLGDRPVSVDASITQKRPVRSLPVDL